MKYWIKSCKRVVFLVSSLLFYCDTLSGATVSSAPMTPNLFPEPALSPGKVPVSVQAREIRLTLEYCVKKAILEGTSVLKSEYNNQNLGAQLLQAYGQFLPTLSGNANYGYTAGTTYSTEGNPAYVTGSGINAGYTITTSLNIFNGVADYAGFKSAILKRNAAALSVIRAKQQIKLDVIQSFFQVVLDHWLVDISESNLNLSLERQRLMAARVKVGLNYISDLLQQEARTSAQAQQLLSIRNTLLRDQLSLLKRLRLDVIKGYRFIEPNLVEANREPVPKSEKKLLEIALAHRLDLQASASQSEAQGWDVSVARAAYFPKLSLVASMSSVAHYLDSLTVNGAGAVPPIQNNIGYQLGNQIQYSAGINLTWTFFDGFLTQQRVSQLQTVANGGELDLRDLKNAVEADVRQAYGDYITVLQQLHASVDGLKAAEKSYAVLSGRYSVGGINFLDLLTGQDVLVQAQSNHAQALIALQLQEEALRFATGEMTVDPLAPLF